MVLEGQIAAGNIIKWKCHWWIVKTIILSPFLAFVSCLRGKRGPASLFSSSPQRMPAISWRSPLPYESPLSFRNNGKDSKISMGNFSYGDTIGRMLRQNWNGPFLSSPTRSGRSAKFCLTAYMMMIKKSSSSCNISQLSWEWNREADLTTHCLYHLKMLQIWHLQQLKYNFEYFVQLFASIPLYFMRKYSTLSNWQIFSNYHYYFNPNVSFCS